MYPEIVWQHAKRKYRQLLANVKVLGLEVDNLALVRQALEVVSDEDCKTFARQGWERLMRARPIDPRAAPARVTQLLQPGRGGDQDG